jgi:hypothetical protein
MLTAVGTEGADLYMISPERFNLITHFKFEKGSNITKIGLLMTCNLLIMYI